MRLRRRRALSKRRLPAGPAPTADGARRIAEAGTEQMIEVRNVGKADFHCNVGNPSCFVASLGQQGEGSLQPELVHARGERCPRFLQECLQIARRNLQAARHCLHTEFRVLKVRGDMVEGGRETRGGDPARAGF
jgi:hypothetical protein